ACLASRCLTKRAAFLFLVFATGAMVGRQMGAVRHPEAIEPPSGADQQLHTRETLAVENTLVADGKKIVVADLLLMDQARYYSKRPEMYVMYPHGNNPLHCKYYIACLGVDALAARAEEVAAIYPSTTLLNDLRAAGFQATVRMTNPMVVYFSRR